MTFIAGASRVVSAVTRHNDIAMVALLVVVVTLMIIPMPTALVDTLIGANLTISFLMLMMAMYVKTPLEFSSFPTMLLFTTLFRVGLNITTTRLILLQADAGEIIFTFGEFATGSNFVVGAVVFLILTIIQFLVVAKGAERVAEVGARFTLDAMPGKQMSIDADLRAGVIDMDEAQKRRADVQMESKMYGAMDGAMKFVKGDSIAGMIVVAINIIGGTIIGVTQRGMTAGEALQLYGILTIGDGLVSQIPSLLVSISAGILITRSGDTREDLGAQVGGQFFNQPRALQMAGALIFLLALIPGFPKPQLFTMAAAVFLFGVVLSRIKSAPPKPDAQAQLQKTLAPVAASSPKKRAKSAAGADEFLPTVPIILDISPDLGETINFEEMNAELAELRRALYLDLGVPFPGINIRPNPNIGSYTYVLNLNEIPLARGELVADCVMVREKKENLALLGISVREGAPFLPDVESLWVSRADADRLAAAGIACMDHAKILAYHLSLLLSRHAESFIGMQETKYLLDRMEERAPDLVREATRLLPMQRIADIFKRLVQERVSIRDLRSILQALIDWAPREKDPVMLTEYVRTALKRQISYMNSRGQNMLPVILMEPQLEETIRKAIRQTSAGAFLSLDPASSKKILDALQNAVGRGRHGAQKPVLMVSMDIRRYVRRLIEAKFYEIPVMAYQEVTPEISVQPVARLRI